MRKILLLGACLYLGGITGSLAQCGAGYTRDTLNWDYLDFIPNSGSYISPVAYTTLATSQTQRFCFGKQKLVITHNYTGSNIGGDVTTHTAQTGSYGKGADIKFTGNGTISFEFQEPVENIKFSVSDIDLNQRVIINSASLIHLSSIGSSILTIESNDDVSVSAVSDGSTIGNNSTDGTLNIDIAGPVKNFTINIEHTDTNGSENGSFYISDISACSQGSFPLNYYHVSKPFTGQGSYVVCARNDSIYYVNVANGVAKFLFADYGHNRINSLAYDPYRHMVYYAYSLSGPGGGPSATNRILRRYDYDMDTLGVVCNDLRTLGIPLFNQSIESGAAGFYDGAIYVGIEGGTEVSDRESIVWRIDLDENYAPNGPASQVFGIRSDTHDWSDIGFNDGILYDFDGDTDKDFYHKNLLTGEVINYKPAGTLVPRQTCVDWTGKMYNVGSPGAIAAGTIVPYNGDGTVNSAQLYTIKFRGVAETGSWGDAAEAFKPKTDFGDAPDSYDPVTQDPATHERDERLRLGNLLGIEWAKHTSPDATGDGAEEDGLNGNQVIAQGVSNHIIKVKVFNNTGEDATIAGWIDSNLDGIFQPSEGATANVPTADTMQSIDLAWIGIDMPYPIGTSTFMRIRVTSAAYGMTAANPNGFYDNGEVEDYKIEVVNVLPAQHSLLSVNKTADGKAFIKWFPGQTGNSGYYRLERKDANQQWQQVYAWEVAEEAYQFLDNHPVKPVSYYRVSFKPQNEMVAYSEIRFVQFEMDDLVHVYPNPASGLVNISFESPVNERSALKIFDNTGRLCLTVSIDVRRGWNTVPLQTTNLPNGGYQIYIDNGIRRRNSTLIVRH
jgi:hypothetical protein